MGAHLPMPAIYVPRESKLSKGRDCQGEYFPEVDSIKGVCIMVVVLIHSLPNLFFTDQISAVDRWLFKITRFAVPGFLACSGYISASSSRNRECRAIRHRLRRVLLPYFVFFVAAQSLDGWQPSPFGEPPLLSSATNTASARFFGSNPGIYYYVFVIATLIVVTPLIARIPDSCFPVVAIAAVTTHILVEARLICRLPFFWQARNPLRSLGPFLLGWLVFSRRAHVVEALLGTHRCIYLALLSALVSFGAVGLVKTSASTCFGKFLETSTTYWTLAWLYAICIPRRTTPAALSWLSGASYPIYLSHYLFLAHVPTMYPETPSAFNPARIVVLWATGLGNSALLVVIGRHLLGKAW
eukprot:CAMPEP_0170217700 /NCGR_PEP_ID=MMETSP0116_2-20130129/8517_1 /TAXON_ID=400756 /ORGANISM="Durinskia baltica, Strain CSIRO CS-38" /LENGTH=354 /DNA_ID=CAMNT_0010468337 /DNA_START=28 /DNA_END=1089 /DNA_ORIENTATION=-